MASRISFYAVKQGSSPGIYTEWSEAELSLRGHPEPLFKTFRTQLAAEAFLNGWETGSSSSGSGGQSVPFGYGGPTYIPPTPVTQLGLATPFQEQISRMKYKDRKSKRHSSRSSSSQSLSLPLPPSEISPTSPNNSSSSVALPRQTSTSLAPPTASPLLSLAIDPVGGRRRSPLIQIVVEEEEEEEADGSLAAARSGSLDSPAMASESETTSDCHAEGGSSGSSSTNSDDAMMKTAERKSSVISGLGVAFGGLLSPSSVGPLTPPGSPDLNNNSLWDLPSGGTVPGAYLSESKPTSPKAVKSKKSGRFSTSRLSGLFTSSSPNLSALAASSKSPPSSKPPSPVPDSASTSRSTSPSSSVYATPSDRTPTASTALWGPEEASSAPNTSSVTAVADESQHVSPPLLSPSTPNLNALVAESFNREASGSSLPEPPTDYYSPFASAATPVFSRSSSSGSVILPMRSPSASGTDLLNPPSIRSIRPVSSVSSLASMRSQQSLNQELGLPRPRFYSYTSEFGSNASGSSVGGGSLSGTPTHSAPSSIKSGITGAARSRMSVLVGGGSSADKSVAGSILTVADEKEGKKKKKGLKHKMKKIFGGNNNAASVTGTKA